MIKYAFFGYIMIAIGVLFIGNAMAEECFLRDAKKMAGCYVGGSATMDCTEQDGTTKPCNAEIAKDAYANYARKCTKQTLTYKHADFDATNGKKGREDLLLPAECRKAVLYLCVMQKNSNGEPLKGSDGNPTYDWAKQDLEGQNCGQHTESVPSGDDCEGGTNASE